MIDHDLTARALTSEGATEEEVARHSSHGDGSRRLSMIVLRYSTATRAAEVAEQFPPDEKTLGGLQVELVVETDATGARYVTDHKLGPLAVAKYNLASWGILGIICGAISVATGGEGVLGFLEGGLVTGLGYAIFGLAAGALYGLWAGRTTSARRLKGVAPLLTPDTSVLVAWAEAPLDAETTAKLGPTTDVQRLILGFNPVRGGAILEAA